MSLVDHVISDLRTHISAHGEGPCKLTYASLADHYNVSFTPIRAAVARLIEEGYLTVSENRRLSVNSKRRRRRTGKAVESPSTPVAQESEIRKMVILQGLKGESVFLREEALARDLGIGRTALRPILGRLSGAGFLVYEPRRGWRVRCFDASDLCSFLEVREVLELKALELAFDDLDPGKLRALLESNRSGDLGETGDAEDNLHGYWISLANNHYISDFIIQQGAYYRTLLDFSTYESHQTVEMANQHCEILEALLDRKLSRAKKLLSKHILAQKPVVKSLIRNMRE